MALVLPRWVSIVGPTIPVPGTADVTPDLNNVEMPNYSFHRTDGLHTAAHMYTHTHTHTNTHTLSLSHTHTHTHAHTHTHIHTHTHTHTHTPRRQHPFAAEWGPTRCSVVNPGGAESSMFSGYG